jgi:hypothetical protein
MRRLVLLSLILASAVCATAALATPSRTSSQTATFTLRIDFDGPFEMVLTGNGTIDGVHRLSTYDYVIKSKNAPTLNGKRMSAVIGASPRLVAFLSGPGVAHLPAGRTWLREDGLKNFPLVDPSLALRLDTSHSPARGTARVGGVKTTKYSLRVPLPEAALLLPAQSPEAYRGGLPVTVWVDAARNVRRLRMFMSHGAEHFSVDEQLADFGSVVHVTRPGAAVVWIQR